MESRENDELIVHNLRPKALSVRSVNRQIFRQRDARSFTVTPRSRNGKARAATISKSGNGAGNVTATGAAAQNLDAMTLDDPAGIYSTCIVNDS